MFEESKIYEVKLENIISKTGINQIQQLLSVEYNVFPTVGDFEGLEIKNSKGKITKRISKNVRKKFDVKITPEHLSEIGNITNQHSTNGIFHFQITSDMDIWTEARENNILQKNDSGASSCFRPGGCYHHNWEQMEAHDDFYCVRVLDNGNLIARCWLYDNNGQLYLFNAYGIVLTKLTIIIANGLNTKSAIGNYQGATDGSSGIYINNDKITVIGDNVVDEEYLEEMPFDADYLCYECDDEPVAEEGDYCHYCHDEIFMTCYECGCVERQDDGIDVNGDDYCEDCYTEVISSCEICGCEEREDYLNNLDGNLYCNDCTVNCDHCKKLLPENNTQDIGNVTLCEECYIVTFCEEYD